MIAKDGDLIATRREAWLCFVGVPMTVAAFPVLIGALVVDVRSTIGVITLVVAVALLLGSRLALSLLWRVRHQRNPDLFPGWGERNFAFHATPVWRFEHARYPTSFWCAWDLLRPRESAEPHGP